MHLRSRHVPTALPRHGPAARSTLLRQKAFEECDECEEAPAYPLNEDLAALQVRHLARLEAAFDGQNFAAVSLPAETRSGYLRFLQQARDFHSLAQFRARQYAEAHGPADMSVFPDLEKHVRKILPKQFHELLQGCSELTAGPRMEWFKCLLGDRAALTSDEYLAFLGTLPQDDLVLLYRGVGGDKSDDWRVPHCLRGKDLPEVWKYLRELTGNSVANRGRRASRAQPLRSLSTTARLHVKDKPGSTDNTPFVSCTSLLRVAFEYGFWHTRNREQRSSAAVHAIAVPACLTEPAEAHGPTYSSDKEVLHLGPIFPFAVVACLRTDKADYGGVQALLPA